MGRHRNKMHAKGPTARDEARHARADAEAALDRCGWKWSKRLSLWIDVLVIIEASGR